MKILVNKCYGGFSLSHEAIMRYAELKGIVIYTITETETHGKFKYCKYDKNDLWGVYYITKPLKKDGQYEKDSWFSHHEIERNDPILVQVIEELGSGANGRFANLNIVEIPDDIEWEIEEYDGQEWVSESHMTW